MNWRSQVEWLDWIVPLAFGLGLCLLIPLGTAFEFGADEGFEFMKGWLVSLGHPLYGEFWNDQPPLHTEIMAVLFKICGPSALVGRLLSVAFATLLVTAFYQTARMRSGRAAGVIAVVFLAASPSFLQLSASVMLEVPAMAAGMASVWSWFRYKECTRAKWLWISGALLGCALQVKPTAVIFLPALAVNWIVSWRTDARSGQFALARETNQMGSESWFPDSCRSALLWCGTAVGAFLLIAFCFYRAGTLDVFFHSHFSKETAAVVSANEAYAFHTKTLVEICEFSFPAAAGMVLIVLQRRRDLVFPVVLLLTAVAIHLWHRPFWYYYQLHFSIPLAWLGAVAVLEIFRMLWEQPLAMTRWRKWKFGAGLLTWSAVISLVVTTVPVNLWNEIALLRAAVPAAKDVTVAAFKRHAAGTRWAFTNERSAAFWAGLRIPPELAVIPSKRMWSGQIGEAEVLRWLQRYQPEIILVPQEWEMKFKLTGYLRKHYRADTESGVERLYLISRPQ